MCSSGVRLRRPDEMSQLPGQYWSGKGSLLRGNLQGLAEQTLTMAGKGGEGLTRV